MQISKRMAKIDSSGIRRVFELGKSLENPINLSIGQPDFDVPDLIKDYACAAIKNGFNGYTLTAGLPKLREKLLERLVKTKNANFEDIIITSGVSGALFLALFVLVDNGDEVLVPDPYFVSYKHLVSVIGGVPVFIDTYPDFALDAEKLEKHITKKTKLLLLNSPANPTGKIYSKEELLSIANVAKKHNLIVISDEIYDSFVYEGNYISISSLYKNTLVLSGYSKTLAMPGWRVGYALGPKEIIGEMIKLQQYSFVCAPSFAQEALLSSLEYDTKKLVDDYKIKRDLICSELQNNFDFRYTEGAFYTFPKVPCKFKSGDEFFEEALKHNVLLIPGSVFSEQNTHFRISFANSLASLRKGAAILNSL